MTPARAVTVDLSRSTLADTSPPHSAAARLDLLVCWEGYRPLSIATSSHPLPEVNWLLLAATARAGPAT
jgi:hypothetical protein